MSKAKKDKNYQGYLDAAQALIGHIEAGDDDAIEAAIERMTHMRETQLFQELGTLTRELHEALKSFKLDTRISDLASSEIPDARERLNHVISLTEQAAHRTLTAIEESLPLVESWSDQGKKLAEQWQRFRNRELSVDEFRQLSRDMEAYLTVAEEHGGKLHTNLTEALMAQDYQDLTGQIIRRVINLVQEVEENLVHLVKLSGQRIVEEKVTAADKQIDESKVLEGPRVPGVTGDDVVQGQDDVDDLLSSLGF